MKQLLTILTLSLLIVACSTQTQEIPEDLQGKKTLLAQKQDELKILEKEISALTEQIEEIEPKKEDVSKLVTVIEAKRSDFKRFVEIQAAVESDDHVSVSAEIGGRLLAVYGKEGQYVKKGQLMAVLDMETLNKQKAELLTSLDLAIITYERQDKLWKQNIGSEIQYLQAKNNKERLERSLETLEFQLTKANVYAPISGVIDMEVLKAGELASPGLPIFQLLNLNRIKVVADVPENYLRSIRKGENVDIHIPALDKDFKAKVSLIGRSINPSNRTFKVEVSLLNPGNMLKPNLMASMFINDLTLEDVIVIPQDLVQQEIGGRDYIYVSDKTKEGIIAKKMYVTTGESNDGSIVISEGLIGTETIIKEGARRLSEGELIKY